MNDAELLTIIAQAEREGWTELDLSGNDLEGLHELDRVKVVEDLAMAQRNDELIEVICNEEISNS